MVHGGTSDISEDSDRKKNTRRTKKGVIKLK